MSDILKNINPTAPFDKWADWYIELYSSKLKDFRELLGKEPNEHSLQKFLQENPWYLIHASMDGFYSGATSTRTALFPKFKLGNEFETDFLFISGNSGGLSCTLIELERSDVKLFTKQGDPTKQLTHAIRQIVDWNAWLNDNQDFALREIARATEDKWNWPPILRKPFRFIIIIGRRAFLDKQANRRRAELCNLNPGLEIITYDRLCDDYYFDKGEQIEAEDSRTISEFSNEEIQKSKSLNWGENPTNGATNKKK